MSSISPESLMSLTAGRALSMDHISGGGVPEWTAEDAALACKDLEVSRWAAFAYRWAGDDSMRSRLYGCLFNSSCELAETEQWPARVAGERYVERLVWIAIAEDKHWLIGQLKIWPAFVRLPIKQLREVSAPGSNIARIAKQLTITAGDEQVWNQVQRKYEGVRGIIDGWCHDAHRHMMRRIRDVEEVA